MTLNTSLAPYIKTIEKTRKRGDLRNYTIRYFEDKNLGTLGTGSEIVY